MKIRSLFLFSIFSLLSQPSYSTVYDLPKNHDNVVAEYPNEMAVTRAEKNETLLDVARQFSLGQVEIVRLNQDIDRWLIKKNQVITLPNKRVLPDSPHNGITLNIAEYRMYYYAGNGKVYSFAHGVGRQDWKTPLGKTTIQKKVKDPVWRPPESIRQEHAAQGDFLPEVVPAGIHNPLGAYALYLNLPGDYRIHGTDIDKIYGIGMQITHGCVRMYPEDIEQLYQMVSEGTAVYIVKQPIKVGWLDNVLNIESHPDLEGDETTLEGRMATALALIQKANNYKLPAINESALKDALEKQTGNPTAIYQRSAEEIAANEAAPPIQTELENIEPPKPPVVAKPVIKTKMPVPVAKLTNSKSAKKISKTTLKTKSVAPISKKEVAKKKPVAKPIVKPITKPIPTNYHHI